MAVKEFAYHITAGGKAAALARDAALKARGGFVWIHLGDRSQENHDWLVSDAKLDPVVAENLTATESRPRCDVFDHGALLNLRGLTDEEMTHSDPLASIRMWGAKGRLISVGRQHMTSVDTVEQRLKRGELHDPGDIITALADAITAELDPQVAALGDDLDDCETRLDSAQVFDLRGNVNKVRRRSIGYRRFLSPQRIALEKLAHLDAEWLEEEDRIHLSAAADRAARMAEELESIRERAGLMHDALTDLRAEQLDTRSLLISVIAMVFLPLTFVTGLYGMNVEGIWFAQERWAFDAIAGFCVFVSLAIGIWFVRRHWFR